MDKWKKLGRRLLYPPGWVMVILAVFSTALLIPCLALNRVKNPVAYVSFVLSAYTLTVVVVFFIKTFPKYYRDTKQKLYDHPMGNRYMTDPQFKVKVSLYVSLFTNIAYSAFKLASGVYYSSFWWGAIAVYYVVLSVMRFLLLRHMNRGEQSILSQLKRYRFVGILMGILNLTLTGIIFQMVWQGKTYSYPEVVVIAVAVYTFYSVTMSIVDIVRYRKYNSPVLSASKAIRFAAALVSLLTLETAMLSLYGEDEGFTTLMTSLTGGGVCIIIMAISVYMTVRSTKEIRKITKVMVRQ